MSSVAGSSVSEFRKLFELVTAFFPQATSKEVGPPPGFGFRVAFGASPCLFGPELRLIGLRTMLFMGKML